MLSKRRRYHRWRQRRYPHMPWAPLAPSVSELAGLNRRGSMGWGSTGRRGTGTRRRQPSRRQMAWRNKRWEGQQQKRKERWKENIINKVVWGKLPYSVLPEKWRGDYISAKKERLRKTQENVRRQYGDGMGKIPGHLTYHKGGTKGTAQDLNWLGPRTHYAEDKLGGTTIHIPKRFYMGDGKWDEEGIKKYVAYQKRTRKSDKKDWVSV